MRDTRAARRELTPDEVELWHAVTATVRPRLPRRSPDPENSKPKSPALAGQKKRIEPRAQPVEPGLKPLLGIDRRARRDLTKGRLDIEARLDLHGLRVAEAHGATLAFLHRAHRDSLRVVLIVTGKGGRKGREDGWSFETGVGILRKQVPQWLADARLRHIVAAFGEAAERHGGEGALYVRLRRS